MSNKITLNFIPCEPLPKLGYQIWYRPTGSAIPYRDGGTFTSSPAVIIDENDMDGTNYEGYIKANSDSDCTHVPFFTGGNTAGIITNTAGSGTSISGIFFGVTNDYLPVSAEGGYYVNDGQTRNGVINDKFNNTVSNLLVYINPANPALGVKVKDSNGVEHCQPPSGVSNMIYQFDNIRLSNDDGFTITLLNTTC